VTEQVTVQVPVPAPEQQVYGVPEPVHCELSITWPSAFTGSMTWHCVTPPGPACGWHWLSVGHAPTCCVPVQVPGDTQSASMLQARVALLLHTFPAHGPMKLSGLLWSGGTTDSFTAQAGGLPGQIVAQVDAMPTI